MAYLLGLENVHFEYPVKTIFKDVTVSLEEGMRVGVVGRNGDGKSTLLNLIEERLLPMSGHVRKTNAVRIASLRQQDELDDTKTIRQNVFGDMPEYEWASDARLRSIAQDLIGDLNLDGPITTLSGGERRRVDLARVLTSDANVLLFDEPTNHLDMHAIAWLANHLKKRFRKGEGAFVIVTHDRWFLDEVCEQMWEVHDGTLDPFEGGYSAYVQQRVERDRIAEVTEQKRQNLLRRELAWLSRGARARSSKPRFHVEAARALIAEDPPIRNAIELKRAATSRLGKQCVDFKNVTFSFSATGGAPAKPILQEVTWPVGPGERFGLLGENGAGKSTVLQLAMARLLPQAGYVRIGKTVKFAYLSQQLEELEPEMNTVVRDILKHYKSSYIIDGKEASPSQLLERLGFNKKHLNSRVCDLSGGQRRTLMLMLILLDAPNVLVLDEPSNDLDIDMLQAMENLLDTWPGTLLVVSHDRYFLERVTDNQYALIDGKIVHCPGGVDGYLELLDAQQSTAANASAKTNTGAQVTSASSSAEASSKKLQPGLSNVELRETKKALSSTERKMHTLQSKIADKQKELYEVDPADYVTLIDMQAAIEKLKAELDTYETEWFRLTEILEGAL